MWKLSRQKIIQFSTSFNYKEDPVSLLLHVAVHFWGALWKNKSSRACPECSLVMWHDSVREKNGEKNHQKRMETKIQATFSAEQGPVLTVKATSKPVDAQKGVFFMGILFMPAVATRAKSNKWVMFLVTGPLRKVFLSFLAFTRPAKWKHKLWFVPWGGDIVPDIFFNY